MTPEAENSAPQPKRVSVVIVTFNRKARLRESLESLGAEHQVIVVVNGSMDGTLALEAEFPEVQFVKLPRNFGLTKGWNLGLRAANSDLALLLHDDTMITPEAVSQLADAMDARPELGVACPLLTSEAGEPAPQVRALPTPASPETALTKAAGDTAECFSTAAFMVRVPFLKAMRYFDENFGTYGAELDFCWQLRHAQKKVAVIAAARAIHEPSASPVPQSALDGDRACGTATYLSKRYGSAGLMYRIKTGLLGLLTFRFAVVNGVFGGAKIDGTR